MKKLLLTLSALTTLLGGTLALAAGEANLKVVVTNVQGDRGEIVVWVYDDADDWLSDRYRTEKSVPVAGNRSGDSVTLELLLPPGEYALSVFQDENNDRKLERNFIGMPKEPAALSNNLRPKFGPPRYKGATFIIGTTPVEQKLELR